MEFAIKPDGDIVAVFASESEPKGGSYALLQAAVQAGGKKLDAFNTYLPKIYSRVGFRPVARLLGMTSLLLPTGTSRCLINSVTVSLRYIFYS